MEKKRQIEVFTAGCGICEEAVQIVRRIACSGCEVTVQNVTEKGVDEKAKQYGIKRLPAVVVDGQLANCCMGGGVDEASLRALGVGSAAQSS